MLLLLLGNVLSVLFRLLHCTEIGGSTYHFYFAYEDCYGSTWIISGVLLIIIFILFSFVFIKLWRMHPSERANEEQVLS